MAAVIPANSIFWYTSPLASKILSFNAEGISDKPTQVIIVPPTTAGTNRLIIFWKKPLRPSRINRIAPTSNAPINVDIPPP